MLTVVLGVNVDGMQGVNVDGGAGSECLQWSWE